LLRIFFALNKICLSVMVFVNFSPLITNVCFTWQIWFWPVYKGLFMGKKWSKFVKFQRKKNLICHILMISSGR
jgi:hypothetical protein